MRASESILSTLIVITIFWYWRILVTGIFCSALLRTREYVWKLINRFSKITISAYRVSIPFLHLKTILPALWTVTASTVAFHNPSSNSASSPSAFSSIRMNSSIFCRRCLRSVLWSSNCFSRCEAIKYHAVWNFDSLTSFSTFYKVAATPHLPFGKRGCT